MLEQIEQETALDVDGCFLFNLFEHLVDSLLLALVLLLLLVGGDLFHCESFQLFLAAEHIYTCFESGSFELEKVGINMHSCLDF